MVSCSFKIVFTCHNTTIDEQKNSILYYTNVLLIGHWFLYVIN